MMILVDDPGPMRLDNAPVDPSISPDPDTLRCTRCGHESPDDLDRCPNCGVSFVGYKEQDMSKAAQVVDMSEAKKKSADDAETAKATEAAAKELKDLEGKIDAARSSHVIVDWEIGQHLSQIFKRDLWRSAVDAEGKGYKSYADYAQRRFDFGKDTARAYVAIADTFKKEEAAQLSITQLWHLARVPEDKDREKLVKQVKAGKFESTRELAAAVKAKRAEKGLKTERAGMEGTVSVTARQKPGVIAEGEMKETRSGGGYSFTFDFGGARFTVTRPKRGNTIQVKLLPSKE